MGTLFGNQSFGENSIEAPVFEGYGVEEYGDQLAVQESYDDSLAIIESLHAVDTATLAMQSELSGVEESSYEAESIRERHEAVIESSLKSGWERLKKFIRDIWGKLKAFFKSVVRQFDGMFKSAQDFVKKYEKDLRGLRLDDFKYKMFKYTNLDNVRGGDAAASISEVQALYKTAFDNSIVSNPTKAAELKRKLDQTKTQKEEILNKRRGDLVGGSSVSEDAFKKELFKTFRNGASGAEDRDEIAVSLDSIISTIKNTEARKTIDEHAKKVDQEYGDVLKKVEAMSRAVDGATTEDDPAGDKSVYAMKAESPNSGEETTRHFKGASRPLILDGCRYYTTLITALQTIDNSYFRAWKDAWAERERTYRAVCLKAFSYKKKKD